MKLSLNQQSLDRTLKVLKRNVPRKSSHPVLTNFNLVAKNGTLNIVSVNNNFDQVSATVEAEVEIEGSISTPALQLVSIVQSLPKGSRVMLEVVGEGDEAKLRLTSGALNLEVETFSSESFPVIPTITTSTELKLPSALISPAFKDALVFASKDSFKASLNGINLKANTDRLTFAVAGCDGCRLYVNRGYLNAVTRTPPFSEVDFTMPLDMVKQIQSLMGGKPKESNLTLGIGENSQNKDSVIAEYMNFTFQFFPIRETYPNYVQITPDKFKYRVELNAATLLNVATRAEVLASGFNNVVKIGPGPDQGSIVVQTTDGKFSEVMEAKVDGNFSDFGLNVSFLVDALKSSMLANKEVVIQLNAPTNPVIIRPVNSTETEDNRNEYTLIMPVQIRS